MCPPQASEARLLALWGAINILLYVVYKHTHIYIHIVYTDHTGNLMFTLTPNPLVHLRITPSFLVSSPLTNSLVSDYELDKQHKKSSRKKIISSFLYLDKLSSSWGAALPNYRANGKTDQFAGFPNPRFKSLHKKKRTTEKMEEVAVTDCRNFLKSKFASWKQPRPPRWPDRQ